MSDYELKEIIDGCINNDRISQEKLYNHTYNKMNILVKKYIDCPHIAVEILNNGYLTAFKKISSYSYKGSFEGWLRRIIYHAVCNYFKKNKKEFYQIENLEIGCNDNDDISYKEILNLVETLPKATKTVFNLHVFEGYTHSQIAKILNICEGTSKWHLAEGRKFLREKIIKLELNIS